MSTYQNPQPAPLADAVGVDAALQALGAKLTGALPWLSHWLGRARPMPRKSSSGSSSGKLTYYPAVWNKANQYHDALPNDAVKAQAFVVVQDPVEAADDWAPGGANELTARCSLIVWANGNAIFGAGTGPRTEELTVQVREVLAGIRGVRAGKSYETAAEVFRGFTLPEMGSVSWLALPYGGFRLDFTFRYPARPC